MVLKNQSSSGSFGNHHKKSLVTWDTQCLKIQKKKMLGDKMLYERNPLQQLWKWDGRAEGAPYLTDKAFPFPSKHAENEVRVTYTRNRVCQRLEPVTVQQWISNVAIAFAFFPVNRSSHCPLLARPGWSCRVFPPTLGRSRVFIKKFYQKWVFGFHLTHGPKIWVTFIISAEQQNGCWVDRLLGSLWMFAK